MSKKIRWLLLGTVAAILPVPNLANASAHDFYKDKTVRIIVGFGAGGGFDLYARTIARHMGRRIPGNPTMIVENMPGAGGVIAANHLYKAAKPDGLTLGNFQGGLLVLLGQVLGRLGIEFDTLKFEYLGVPVKDSWVCALTKASGVTNMEQWMAAKTPVKLGGVSASATDDIAKILKEALGLPIQLVTGYKGTADIRLAAEAGEVAGGCWNWESVKTTWAKGIDSGEAVVVLQMLPRPHPELHKVPNAINFAKTEEARQLIKVGIQDTGSTSRLYALPPGTPKERVQMMRKAFMDTMKDPEFLAEAKKSKLDIDPESGEAVQKTVAELFKLSPAQLARLKEILK